jgi:hypothetical protein
MQHIALAVAEAHSVAHAVPADPEKALPWIIIGLIVFRIGLGIFSRKA